MYTLSRSGGSNPIQRSIKGKKMTEIEKLELLLKGLGAELVGVTLGEEESTPEDIARAIRKSLIAGRRGKWRDIDLSF